MKLIARILILVVASLAGASSGQKLTGEVKGFNIEEGKEIGIYLLASGDSENTLVRICAASKPGQMDLSFYYYDLAKKALTESRAVELTYIESREIDTVTKRNKLCVANLIY